MKRFHFIRFLCCTFCCALSILQCFSSQAEQNQFYSTLRTECPDAFQYSTTVGNAVINVDAPILLPDTHSIPLLRLRWIMYDEAYNNRRIISAGNTSDLAMHNNIYYSRFIIASDQASGSDILPEEAANALEQLRKANGISEDIRIWAQYATSGMYAIPNGSATDEAAFMRQNKPVKGYEKGMYIVRARQYLFGIPIFFTSYFQYSNENEPEDPCPTISLSYLDKDNYHLEYSVVSVESIITENVALAPFTKICDQIKLFMDLGLIHRIDKIELGYMLYYENDVHASTPRAEYIMLAIPTWTIYGYFNYAAFSGETETFREDNNADQRIINEKVRAVWGNDCMRIDALTGDFVDMSANPAPRVYRLTGDE